MKLDISFGPPNGCGCRLSRYTAKKGCLATGCFDPLNYRTSVNISKAFGTHFSILYLGYDMQKLETRGRKKLLITYDCIR